MLKKKQARNSDMYLIWQVWYELGHIDEYNAISYDNFLNATSFETIVRIRRKIQEQDRKKIKEGTLSIYNSLLPDEKIAEYRKEKENTKGTFIFQENIEYDELCRNCMNDTFIKNVYGEYLCTNCSEQKL